MANINIENISELEHLDLFKQVEYKDAAICVGGVVSVPAGPIWNNDDAKVKCPAVTAAAGGTWTGHWRTTIPGKMSVCHIK